MSDVDLGQATGFEHGQADETKGNHMDQEFLMKSGGRFTMPGRDFQGMLKIAIEGLDIPTEVVDWPVLRQGKGWGLKEK